MFRLYPSIRQTGPEGSGYEFVKRKEVGGPRKRKRDELGFQHSHWKENLIEKDIKMCVIVVSAMYLPHFWSLIMSPSFLDFISKV